MPIADIDAITESHERIGYDRGFRDGYAQATSEVKHGHWIDRSVAFYRKCSECGCCMEWNKEPFLHGDGEYNYCPNCGAKMDEVEKDENN